MIRICMDRQTKKTVYEAYMGENNCIKLGKFNSEKDAQTAIECRISREMIESRENNSIPPWGPEVDDYNEKIEKILEHLIEFGKKSS